MEETSPTRFSSRGPMLARLLLWVAFGVVLVVALWPPGAVDYQWRFHLRGNRTNLYAILSGKPAEADAEANAMAVVSRLDALGQQWSDPVDRKGDVIQTVAWQEDLVALFADGGLFFIGSSGLGYQPAPIKGVGAWQWLAAAAEGPRLMALGLDAEGRPVFSERGMEDWGDLQPVDKIRWSAETARTAAAAARRGEFHLVWTEQPVADTPLGEGPKRQWLRFAYRDAAGKWQGPFEEKSIRPAGPLCIAPFGDKLAMVFREPAAEEEGQPTGELAYAEFTPGDHRWHRVRSIALPAEGGQTSAPEGYGFAQFRDGHVLALRYARGTVTALEMDAETGSLSPMPAPPELEVAGTVRQAPPQFTTGWFLVMIVVTVVMFLVFRAAERKAVRDRLAASPEPHQEAARMMAAQVERLMYLPTLLRRIGAVLLDVMLLTPVALLAIHSLGGLPRDTGLVAMGNQWPPPDSVRAGAIFLGLLFVYHVVMEMLWQRTLGKMVCRVRVVDLSGSRPAWWRIVLRNLLRPVDLAPLMLGLIGLLFIVWTPRHQRLGDLAAGTRVVMSEPAGGGPQDTDTRAT